MLWTLVQTAHLARRRLSEVIGEEGITGPQFGVLAALLDGDDLSSSDLARALLVRPQSMAGLVDGLRARGLVVRDGPGGRGQRTVVTLTDEGRAVARRVRGRLHDLDGTHVTGLAPAQVAELAALLAQVRDTLDADAHED